MVRFQQSRESERSREVKRQRKDGEPQRLSIPSGGQRGSLTSTVFSHQKQSTFNRSGFTTSPRGGYQTVHAYDSRVGVTAAHRHGMSQGCFRADKSWEGEHVCRAASFGDSVANLRLSELYILVLNKQICKQTGQPGPQPVPVCFAAVLPVL